MGKINIIIINGLPRAGKDTFVDMCAMCANANGSINNLCNVSLIDYYKQYMREHFGWTGEKNRSARNLMAALLEYDWNRNGCEKSISNIMNIISNVKRYGGNNIIFIHCRQTYIIEHLVNEIRHQYSDVNVATLLIHNDNVNVANSTNNADKLIFNYNYDYTIYNNDGLDNLKKEADRFIKMLMEG